MEAVKQLNTALKQTPPVKIINNTLYRVVKKYKCKNDKNDKKIFKDYNFKYCCLVFGLTQI